MREGYRAEHLEPAPDRVVVGNAMTRGNPAVEYMLDEGLDYDSGPAWLARHALLGRHVIAVAGTHGKTTVSSLVAWILERTGRSPGWLIGGVAADLGTPGRLGSGPHFVIEADEYDTAFFDKRSKFVHYRPRTLVINNLEYDHADIFDDLASIERQFHHLVRTIPASGCIVAGGPEVERVLAMGCWTEVVRLGSGAGAGADRARASGGLSARALQPDGSRFEVRATEGERERRIEVEWKLAGEHNLHNAAAALAAARSAGVDLEEGAARFRDFRGVERRLQTVGVAGGSRSTTTSRTTRPQSARRSRRSAHGRGGRRGSSPCSSPAPTPCAAASTATPSGRASPPPTRRSRSTREGSIGRSRPPSAPRARVRPDVESLIGEITRLVRPGDHVLVMSNGSFDDLHRRLLARLSGEAAP